MESTKRRKHFLFSASRVKRRRTHVPAFLDEEKLYDSAPELGSECEPPTTPLDSIPIPLVDQNAPKKPGPVPERKKACSRRLFDIEENTLRDNWIKAKQLLPSVIKSNCLSTEYRERKCIQVCSSIESVNAFQ